MEDQVRSGLSAENTQTISDHGEGTSTLAAPSSRKRWPADSSLSKHGARAMINWKRFGIVSFLQSETHALNRKLLILTAASGIANAMNLAVINAAVDALRGGGPSWKHFAWFGLSIALFVYSLRYILYESTRISEAAICRCGCAWPTRSAAPTCRLLEAIGEADIHARISRDTTAIAQAARPLFAAAQGVVMIVFTMGYIALVSPVAMLLCLILDRLRRRQILQGPRGL